MYVWPNEVQRKIYISNSYSCVNLEIEFSQNFNMENLENPECVKTTPETNYQIFLMINIQGFCDKEILHIF